MSQPVIKEQYEVTTVENGLVACSPVRGTFVYSDQAQFFLDVLRDLEHQLTERCIFNYGIDIVVTRKEEKGGAA